LPQKYSKSFTTTMRKFSLKRKMFSETLQNQSFFDVLILILISFWWNFDSKSKATWKEGTFYLWIMPSPGEKGAFMASMSLSHTQLSLQLPPPTDFTHPKAQAEHYYMNLNKECVTLWPWHLL
jgi:hypothetical protein